MTGKNIIITEFDTGGITTKVGSDFKSLSGRVELRHIYIPMINYGTQWPCHTFPFATHATFIDI